MVTDMPANSRRLHVGEKDRYLEFEDGEPFFYLADTAWALFHRLDREQANTYLEDRAEKGFSVIQVVVLSPTSGVEVPNAYGDDALHNKDPSRPNEAFFEHVDYIVDRAEELGLYVAMLPTWGSYWKQSTDENPIFDQDNGREYTAFLAKRYRDSPIIWVLGGDKQLETDGERAVIEAMADGIRSIVGDEQLITFHPRGPGQSSVVFHDSDWLDFDMSQTSHGGYDHDPGLFVERDYDLEPTKPTLDGEPRYEGIPVGFYWEEYDEFDRFSAYDVRQAAYWALLAGACGHAYGDNNVMQFYEPQYEPGIDANVPWQEAIDHPGARQMGLVRRLFESRPFTKLRPTRDLVVDGPHSGGAKVRAAMATDNSFAIVYSPRGEPFTIDKDLFEPPHLDELWYDPRYGTAHYTHSTDNQGFQTYTPPSSGRGNDWVFLIEDAAAEFPRPDEP